MSDLRKRVGFRLRLMCERAGYSQAELAKILGVTPPTVSRWMSGNCPMDLDDISRCAEALKCSLGDLMPPEAIADRSEYSQTLAMLEQLPPRERAVVVDAMAAMCRFVARNNFADDRVPAFALN